MNSTGTNSTAMVSVRIPVEWKEQLLALAGSENKQCSDVLKGLIENLLNGESGPAPLDPSVDARARLRSNLDELQGLHAHKENLDRQVDEKGGKPGLIFSGAPKHLLEAQAAAETALNQLAFMIQANRREIEAIMRGDN